MRRSAKLLLAAVALSALAAGAAADLGGAKAAANSAAAQALAAAGAKHAAAARAAGQAFNAANSTAAALHNKALGAINAGTGKANQLGGAAFDAAGPKLSKASNLTAAASKAAASAMAPKLSLLAAATAAGVGKVQPILHKASNLTAQAKAKAQKLAGPKLAAVAGAQKAVSNFAQAKLNAAVAAEASALNHVAGGLAGKLRPSAASLAKAAALSSQMSEQTQQAQVAAFRHVARNANALATPLVALAQNTTARVHKALQPGFDAYNTIADPIGRALRPKTDLVLNAITAGSNAMSDLNSAVYGAAMDAAAVPLGALVTVTDATGRAVVNMTITQAAALADLGAMAKKLNCSVASLAAANVTDGVVRLLAANAAFVNTTTLDVVELARTFLTQLKRGDPVWPRPKDLANKASGKCSPFEVPAGSISVMDFCRKMRTMNDSYFKEMYEKHAPKQGDAFPLTGCVFGCIVSNGWYTDLQEKFGAAFGWSGKCFSEELRADGTPLHFGSTLQRDYHRLSGKNQTERAATFKGSGDFIFGGQGAFVQKSLHDQRPAWQYYDDPASMRMQMAGGWRTQYNMFQAVGDGVTDEFRKVGNGLVLGQSYYRGPSGLLPDRFRQNSQTNYFMLFQACTADGKIPWYPEGRDVPLAGNP